eukprot:CAMPEP_0197309206 /NCGR_PEP_ID=MMETSP0891-20130614/7764_1 /TAXON_ID=44058 ORGANISM="Aureoumbra lagunensis, Strain CCMP1510" /NCGR_SAMPLE_ID=MMETSP0891 /ASSEMBLY_ACC=CAM_ASM_000534 /LENGTH=586 /DNA_ID=CAMNT_0042794135 /DNA_START=82 /DNA_END=1842 /DNA_ORIENTATION=-
MTARGERVFVDIENKKTSKLPAVALRLEKAAKTTPRHNCDASSSSAEVLEQRLLDAEVRRDIEIEAIRFRAAQSCQPRGTPRNSDDRECESVKKSEQLSLKLEGAAERREAALSAKKAKAAEFGAQRRTEFTISPASTPIKPTNKNFTRELISAQSTKESLDLKLENASARKAENLNKKIEIAAALGTDRCEAAAMNRLKAETVDESARSDLKWALQISISESIRRKEEVLAAIALKASRSGGSEKIQLISEKLTAERKQKAQDLQAKIQRATQLKEKYNQAAIDRAMQISLNKVKRAKSFRDDIQQGRKAALQDTLHLKNEQAKQRRQSEHLDKVVKAASLGTDAVISANQKRDAQTNAQKLSKENRLETKLQAYAKRYEKSKQKIIQKAAKQNEKVADAKMNRTEDRRHSFSDVTEFSSEFLLGGSRQKRNSLDNIQAVKPLTPVDKKSKAAERRRALSCDTKAAVASQLGTARVKAVLQRKINFDEQKKKQRKQALDLKLEAATARHAEYLEITRRGLNGKRNPHAHLPPRRIPKPVVIQDLADDLCEEKSIEESEQNSALYTSLGIGAFVTVIGACLARFTS